MIRDTLRKAIGAYKLLTQREPEQRIVLPSGQHASIDDLFYAQPPQIKRDQYPYGHMSEEGPFLRTPVPSDRVVIEHAEKLLERTGVVVYKGFVFPSTEIRINYEGVLFQSHALEPRVYEILERAIDVRRSQSCTAALARTFASEKISGKSLGAVRTLVEEIGETYSVPKEGDI